MSRNFLKHAILGLCNFLNRMSQNSSVSMQMSFMKAKGIDKEDIIVKGIDKEDSTAWIAKSGAMEGRSPSPRFLVPCTVTNGTCSLAGLSNTTALLLRAGEHLHWIDRKRPYLNIHTFNIYSFSVCCVPGPILQAFSSTSVFEAILVTASEVVLWTAPLDGEETGT